MNERGWGPFCKFDCANLSIVLLVSSNKHPSNLLTNIFHHTQRIVAQLYPTYGPSPDGPTAALEPLEPEAFERSFLQGQSQPPGRWASFNWADLWAIAPWLQDRITKQVEGMGLGIE